MRVQIGRQCFDLEVAIEYGVDLGHLLAFQLQPALFLEVVQCLDHPRALGAMVAIQQVEIQGAPGAGAARTGQNGLDELAPLALELRQQRLILQQQLEAVLGEIGIARRDDAAQLQLHQQGLERQRADIAQLRQLAQHQLPLPARTDRTQIVEHGTNPVEFRGIAIDEVLQHAEPIAAGQHQAVRSLTITTGATDLLAVVFHRLG